METEKQQRMNAYSTIALGAAQALVPGVAGRAFGLGKVEDGTALWLGRLLGVSNLAFGMAALDPAKRDALRAPSYVLLAGNAAATVYAASRGTIPKKAAVATLGFIGALVPGVLADRG